MIEQKNTTLLGMTKALIDKFLGIFAIKIRAEGIVLQGRKRGRVK
jgi:hypothetical protein